MGRFVRAIVPLVIVTLAVVAIYGRMFAGGKVDPGPEMPTKLLSGSVPVLNQWTVQTRWHHPIQRGSGFDYSDVGDRSCCFQTLYYHYSDASLLWGRRLKEIQLERLLRPDSLSAWEQRQTTVLSAMEHALGPGSPVEIRGRTGPYTAYQWEKGRLRIRLSYLTPRQYLKTRASRKHAPSYITLRYTLDRTR